MLRRLILILCTLCLSCVAPPERHLTEAPPTKRFALVIGNGNYSSVQALKNPPHDAEAIASSLRQLGFDTRLLLDANGDVLKSSVSAIAEQAQGADAIVVFYAGHAVNLGGENFLLPVSASITKRADLLRDGVDLDWVLDQLRGKAATTVVLLDACRDNPF